MIDIDKIEAQCKSAIQNGYGHLPVIECGNAVKISELISLLRQYEEDAERYRWLLNQHNDVMSKVMVCDGWMLSEPDEVDIIDDLSSFVDEAMKCKQK